MIFKVKGDKIWLSAIAILLIVTIITTIINTVASKETDNNSTPISAIQLNNISENDKKLSGMRGVWIPYMSLQNDKYDEYTEEVFKKKFDNIITIAKEHKINTLFVHIRPFADALYKSEIFPYSHTLTGTQGKKIDYDPLNYMIEQAHKNNMEFHAWINPYRISTKDTPNILAENSIINSLDDNDILEYDGGKYINPASQKGRNLIIKGVKEVVNNYDIDGIQFDDYFYPSSETEIDKSSYEEYKSQLDNECVPLTQYEWRKSNVNILISSVYSSIKQINPNVLFGVSPQGNISNCLDTGADVNTWCNSYGYMDYICPQLYVNFEHSVLPFDTMLKEWQEISKNNKITFCVGLALYKANSDYDEGTWKNSDEILKKEVEYCRKNNIDNFIIYDISYFEDESTANEVENVMSVL